MYTIKHPKKELVQPIDALGNDHGGDVVALDAVKARNRLDGLLSTRSHLARLAAQQRSHNMDDAHETFLTQCAIESTIRQEFPAVFEESYADWLLAEVADEHPAGVLNAECGICCSIAEHCGVNLLPPEAA